MANATTTLPVWETMTAAWEKVGGAKGSLWGGIIIILLVALGFGILQAILGMVPVLKPLIGLIAQIVIIILQAGLVYIGIRRAFDLPFSYDLVFRGLDMNIGWRLIAAYILQTLIIFIPMLCAFGIYMLSLRLESNLIAAVGYIVFGIIGVILFIRMLLVIPFVIDKLVGPVQAIKLSFQATRGHFWSLLIILILTWIFLAICAIPFGIGLIWGFPFAFILTGVIYKRLSTAIRA